MLVRIRKKHIKNGLRCNPTACPLAKALIDLGKDPLVGAEDLNVSGKYYIMSEKTRYFVWDFDKGLPVKPGKYRIIKSSD